MGADIHTTYISQCFFLAPHKHERSERYRNEYSEFKAVYRRSFEYRQCGWIFQEMQGMSTILVNFKAKKRRF